MKQGGMKYSAQWQCARFTLSNQDNKDSMFKVDVDDELSQWVGKKQLAQVHFLVCITAKYQSELYALWRR